MSTLPSSVPLTVDELYQELLPLNSIEVGHRLYSLFYSSSSSSSDQHQHVLVKNLLSELATHSSLGRSFATLGPLDANMAEIIWEGSTYNDGATTRNRALRAFVRAASGDIPRMIACLEDLYAKCGPYTFSSLSSSSTMMVFLRTLAYRGIGRNQHTKINRTHEAISQFVEKLCIARKEPILVAKMLPYSSPAVVRAAINRYMWPTSSSLFTEKLRTDLWMALAKFHAPVVADQLEYYGVISTASTLMTPMTTTSSSLSTTAPSNVATVVGAGGTLRSGDENNNNNNNQDLSLLHLRVPPKDAIFAASAMNPRAMLHALMHKLPGSILSPSTTSISVSATSSELIRSIFNAQQQESTSCANGFPTLELANAILQHPASLIVPMSNPLQSSREAVTSMPSSSSSSPVAVTLPANIWGSKKGLAKIARHPILGPLSVSKGFLIFARAIKLQQNSERGYLHDPEVLWMSKVPKATLGVLYDLALSRLVWPSSPSTQTPFSSSTPPSTFPLPPLSSSSLIDLIEEAHDSSIIASLPFTQREQAVKRIILEFTKLNREHPLYMNPESTNLSPYVTLVSDPIITSQAIASNLASKEPSDRCSAISDALVGALHHSASVERIEACIAALGARNREIAPARAQMMSRLQASLAGGRNSNRLSAAAAAASSPLIPSAVWINKIIPAFEEALLSLCAGADTTTEMRFMVLDILCTFLRSKDGAIRAFVINTLLPTCIQNHKKQTASDGNFPTVAQLMTPLTKKKSSSSSSSSSNAGVEGSSMSLVEVEEAEARRRRRRRSEGGEGFEAGEEVEDEEEEEEEEEEDEQEDDENQRSDWFARTYAPGSGDWQYMHEADKFTSIVSAGHKDERKKIAELIWNTYSPGDCPPAAAWRQHAISLLNPSSSLSSSSSSVTSATANLTKTMIRSSLLLANSLYAHSPVTASALLTSLPDNDFASLTSTDASSSLLRWIFIVGALSINKVGPYITLTALEAIEKFDTKLHALCIKILMKSVRFESTPSSLASSSSTTTVSFPSTASAESRIDPVKWLKYNKYEGLRHHMMQRAYSVQPSLLTPALLTALVDASEGKFPPGTGTTAPSSSSSSSSSTTTLKKNKSKKLKQEREVKPAMIRLPLYAFPVSGPLRSYRRFSVASQRVYSRALMKEVFIAAVRPLQASFVDATSAITTTTSEAALSTSSSDASAANNDNQNNENTASTTGARVMDANRVSRILRIIVRMPYIPDEVTEGIISLSKLKASSSAGAKKKKGKESGKDAAENAEAQEAGEEEGEGEGEGEKGEKEEAAEEAGEAEEGEEEADQKNSAPSESDTLTDAAISSAALGACACLDNGKGVEAIFEGLKCPGTSRAAANALFQISPNLLSPEKAAVSLAALLNPEGKAGGVAAQKAAISALRRLPCVTSARVIAETGSRIGNGLHMDVASALIEPLLEVAIQGDSWGKDIAEQACAALETTAKKVATSFGLVAHPTTPSSTSTSTIATATELQEQQQQQQTKPELSSLMKQKLTNASREIMSKLLYFPRNEAFAASYASRILVHLLRSPDYQTSISTLERIANGTATVFQAKDDVNGEIAILLTNFALSGPSSGATPKSTTRDDDDGVVPQEEVLRKANEERIRRRSRAATALLSITVNSLSMCSSASVASIFENIESGSGSGSSGGDNDDKTRLYARSLLQVVKQLVDTASGIAQNQLDASTSLSSSFGSEAWAEAVPLLHALIADNLCSMYKANIAISSSAAATTAAESAADATSSNSPTSASLRETSIAALQGLNAVAETVLSRMLLPKVITGNAAGNRSVSFICLSSSILTLIIFTSLTKSSSSTSATATTLVAALMSLPTQFWSMTTIGAGINILESYFRCIRDAGESIEAAATLTSIAKSLRAEFVKVAALASSGSQGSLVSAAVMRRFALACILAAAGVVQGRNNVYKTVFTAANAAITMPSSSGWTEETVSHLQELVTEMMMKSNSSSSRSGSAEVVFQQAHVIDASTCTIATNELARIRLWKRGGGGILLNVMNAMP